jgi:Zn-dependent membrane protease YugP
MSSGQAEQQVQIQSMLHSEILSQKETNNEKGVLLYQHLTYVAKTSLFLLKSLPHCIKMTRR